MTLRGVFVLSPIGVPAFVRTISLSYSAWRKLRAAVFAFHMSASLRLRTFGKIGHSAVEYRTAAASCILFCRNIRIPSQAPPWFSPVRVPGSRAESESVSLRHILFPHIAARISTPRRRCHIMNVHVPARAGFSTNGQCVSVHRKSALFRRPSCQRRTMLDSAGFALICSAVSSCYAASLRRIHG